MASLATLAATQVGHQTKGELAYSVLREAILSGVLAPGEHLQGARLAKNLKMSVIPVREALRKLEQEGLVATKPHVGATVKELPIIELEENLLIRGALEALAASLAAPHISEATLTDLEGLMLTMEECVHADNIEQYGSLNKQFHLTIYNVIPYRNLYDLIESIWNRMPRARSVFVLAPGHLSESQAGHRKLLDALRRKDAQKAEQLTHEQKTRAVEALRNARAQKERQEATD